jgi:hypothetical protein
MCARMLGFSVRWALSGSPDLSAGRRSVREAIPARGRGVAVRSAAGRPLRDGYARIELIHLVLPSVVPPDDGVEGQRFVHVSRPSVLVPDLVAGAEVVDGLELVTHRR